MKIERFQPDQSKTCNVYFIGDEGKPCIVVDPGSNKNGFLDRYIDKHHDGKVLGILLTHGHYDHIGGLVTLEHKCPLFIHESEEDFLINPELNGSGWHEDMDDIVLEGIHKILLSDGDEIKLGDHVFEVIHTPFHTKGSVCFYEKEEGVLFSGDTLFHLTIGRSDLPTSTERTIATSLLKLTKLPDNVRVLPGHGRPSTIGAEKTYNPFLAQIVSTPSKNSK